MILNDRDDKKYIKKILKNQDLDMKELRIKTEKALSNNPDYYYGIVKWISGNCWLNTLITNNFESELSNVDKKIIESINKTIELVEAIDKELILYHGFEKFTNYNEESFKIGSIISFPGILSKTTYFPIAQQFANTQNYYRPKYFIIFYPKKSKHIGLDIKTNIYDEYEYIGKQGEKFEIIKICKVFYNLQLQTFYICKSLDY
jgi:hypothetical protein